jgi:hypothetical protein
MKKKILLFIMVSTISFQINGQVGQWSSKEIKTSDGSYINAFVISQDGSDQFRIRFSDDGRIEFYYLTKKDILKFSLIAIKFSDVSIDRFEATLFKDSIEYLSQLEKVNEGEYKFANPKESDESVFVKYKVNSKFVSSISNSSMVSLFKENKSFNIKILTKDDNGSDRSYVSYFSLNGAINRINQSQISGITKNNSQIIGIDFSKAIIYDQNNGVYEKLEFIKSENGPIYFINYDQTNIGIKHAFEEVSSILKNNNRSIDPDLNNSYLASNVTNYTEFDILNKSILNDESEIKLYWKLNAKYVLLLQLKKDSYMIMFLHAESDYIN